MNFNHYNRHSNHLSSQSGFGHQQDMIPAHYDSSHYADPSVINHEKLTQIQKLYNNANMGGNILNVRPRKRAEHIKNN